MVRFEDSSPFREGSREPKSSTPVDNKPCEDMMTTPLNPPPIRSSLTSLPRPLFSDEPVTYSTKKERRGEGVGFKPPPRPPAKSCPPKSRIFKTNDLYKAQAVTFLDSPDGKRVTGTPLNPKLYDTKIKKSYFHQAFTVESEVGRGYFGTVFRVRSKEDGKMYAVKIANEKYKGYSDRDRKLEEVRKHQFLPSHRNCVKFYSSWEEEGRLYQQFELCNGNLKDYCEEHENLSESLVWGYLVDLLQALQHLHNHDLVHMDIKPDNIFFGCDGRCKLGDFGLIVDLINESLGGWREGDSKYLAPEVLKGKVTKSCDVFSLGITILELACDLDLPNKGQLWSDLRTRGPDPSLTLQLSPELRRVIQLMMTQDPERRPPVNQILELPSVAKAVRRREREIVLATFLDYLLALVSPIIFLLTWLLGCLEDLSKWRPKKRKTSLSEYTPPAEQVEPGRLWFNDAYSDDENDCTVSSAGSDLAAPLQDSTSSSSNPSPTSSTQRSPVRRPATSPSKKSRARFSARTPLILTKTGFRSPQKRLFLDGMDESPTSQMKDLPPQEQDEDDEEQVIWAPQNLAKTFDCFSDDEF